MRPSKRISQLYEDYFDPENKVWAKSEAMIAYLDEQWEKYEKGMLISMTNTNWEKRWEELTELVIEDGGMVYSWKCEPREVLSLIKDIVIPQTRREMGNDLQNILNRCRTEKGLGVSLAKYIKAIITKEENL